MNTEVAARHDIALSDDALRMYAPSVFAMSPKGDVSKRYRFIPTIDVVDKLRQNGLVPVSAVQGRVRSPANANYTRHMLRFRREEDLHGDQSLRRLGDAVFEIVMLNSHDRSSIYTLEAGVFRLACLNGMIVSDVTVGRIAIRHLGAEDLFEKVLAASNTIIEAGAAIAERVSIFQKTVLTYQQQTAFAVEALKLRGSALTVEPHEILGGRRSADLANADGTRDLWRTVNVVQENLVRGGLEGHDSQNRVRHLRGIRAIEADVKLNRSLWSLADQFQKAA